MITYGAFKKLNKTATAYNLVSVKPPPNINLTVSEISGHGDNHHMALVLHSGAAFHGKSFLTSSGCLRFKTTAVLITQVRYL